MAVGEARRASGAALLLAPGIVVCIAGVLLSRADVVLVGAALLGTLVLARRGLPTVTLDVDEPTTRDDAGDRRLVAPVVLTSAAPAAVLVRVASPGADPVGALVAVDGVRELTASLPLARTGRVPGYSANGIVWSEALDTVALLPESRSGDAIVLPVARRLGEVPVPQRLRGLSGPHGSRRPGAGGDLRDVHPFAPGDRMRGIDWRATARRSPELDEIYVRRTHATSEAHVVVVLDSRDDMAQDIATWTGFGEPRPDRPGSLDLARSAAASLSTTFLRRGDRVGLVDLGRSRAQLRPGAGERHLRRIMHALALARPDDGSVGRTRAPALQAGATVALLSTFLDDDAAEAALVWVARGHEVWAFDMLPAVGGVLPDGATGLAWRVLRLERALRLERLAAAGITVVDWSAPERAVPGPSPEQHLRMMARVRPGGRR
ncbi:DUF58 domain-containing protein [Sanguibacter sp. HDW7]|uniref:DUF58 domain-containing protein n=1 Tax=Sanguibacter sp. HDW7 TaxID=2714931 RepID=UPI00140986DE|nr:DUF58 domain-containing protein [Sanguibacter sp. HDW7]QIK83507.1 DUF58 domain-containing protein [Sanguibacter sp. HDW7]